VLTPSEPDEEPGYTVTVPALPGSITEGDSAEDAMKNAREVIALFIESLDARELPVPTSNEIVTFLDVPEASSAS
jgi:predicted RNase H-like HicB family nuclease